ncbi:hypothetical protein [uncultured Tenacibaculum sp.]|uniref:hypothetical protein n=1 Tax=uncultured Tenacibaculum sp. TaxID=174713 RepID=UPI0026248A6A|nr:hypothetical protein [uncultured Tenacibaculum sp.]
MSVAANYNKESKPLNITGKTFCQTIGITYNGQILQSLRELNLVSFFKVGKKYMYPVEETTIISDKLRNGEISIKTNDGYYITLNEKKII